MKRTLAQVALLGAILAALPWMLTNDYYVTVLILCAINAIVVVGLNLLLGYAGQISLGHAAFYGLAAYATAIATTTYMLPVWAGLLLAVVVTGAVATLIGIPALKLQGHYLGMATLGFGTILYIAFNETLSLTGGPSGFVGIPPLNLFGWEPESELGYYYVIAGTLCGVVLVSLNIMNSRLGRALRALHTSEKAAMVMGVDIARYKLFVFVLSAVFAAVAGFLYAHYLGFIAPSSFGFLFSVELITMVVLGGMANMWGAVIGAFFLTVLPEFLRVFENIEVLLFGIILIVCMVFLPEGIAGGALKLYRKIRGTSAKKSAEAGSGEDSA